MMQLRVRCGALRKRGRPKGLGSKWAYIIEVAIKKIMEEYKDLPLTIRQIFYRLVANYRLPKTESNYNYLCKQMVVHRKNNWFPWERIVDLTRKPVKTEWISGVFTPSEWITIFLKDFLERIRDYHVPLYANQEYLIEVWVEHEGLRPMFEKALEDKHITLYFTRGRNSWSAFYEAYNRLKNVKDRRITILHFSDLDKYGLEMTEDIRSALTETFGLNVEVKRIALTEAQVKEWNLVDTQLEAIDPSRFMELIRESVSPYIDEEKMSETWDRINEGRAEVEEWILEKDIEVLSE